MKVLHTEAQGAGLTESVLSGSTPLTALPKCHLPISVNLPSALSSVAWVPTFDTGDRKGLKNE